MPVILSMDLQVLLRALDLDRGRRRVLVVEDDPSWQKSLTEDLAARGHQVTSAAGASPAGEGRLLLYGEPGRVVEMDSFEVAFLDHYFPGDHDGRTLTAQLRGRSTSIRIVGMSSSTAANEAMQRVGADLAFPKTALKRIFAGR